MYTTLFRHLYTDNTQLFFSFYQHDLYLHYSPWKRSSSDLSSTTSNLLTVNSTKNWFSPQYVRDTCGSAVYRLVPQNGPISSIKDQNVPRRCLYRSATFWRFKRQTSKNVITPPQLVHQFTLIEDQMRKFRGRVCHPRLAFQIFIARQHTDARYWYINNVCLIDVKLGNFFFKTSKKWKE